MCRFLFLLLAFIGLIVVLLAAWLIWPVSPSSFAQPPTPPAPNYQQAIAAFEASVAGTPPTVREDCRPQLLTHGQPTKEVFVLLHGLSNAPIQFMPLAQELFAQGHNVLIPRMPYHGEQDRLTTEWGRLTAADLLRTSNEAADLARGLGDRVTVIGLSVNGTVAAWMAQNRSDLDRIMVLSPFLSPAGLPEGIVTPIAKVLFALPNQFVWWNSELKENNSGPPYAYPRFPTRAVASVLLLGRSVINQSEQKPPACGRIIVVTTASDLALNNAVTDRLVGNWQAHRPGSVQAYEFPADQKIPHDFIDPHQPTANTPLTYAKLLELLKRD